MFIRFDMIHEREKAANVFVSPGDAPATITQLHRWKDNSMPAKPLAA